MLIFPNNIVRLEVEGLPSIDCGLSPSPEIRKSGSSVRVLAIFLFGLAISLIKNKIHKKIGNRNTAIEPKEKEENEAFQVALIDGEEEILNKNKSV